MLQILFSLCKAVRICTQAMRRIKTLFFYFQSLLYYKLPGCVEPGNNTLILGPALKKEPASHTLGGAWDPLKHIFLCMKRPCSRTRGKKSFSRGERTKKMCHPWRNWVTFSSRSEATFHFAETFKSVLSLSAFFVCGFNFQATRKRGASSDLLV